ncbi:protein containing Fumarase C [mine drainage metagenome]|uniref:Protein containing Fumarase C n=1 Tax=mine drainage metagenome TaxID=410659 RepID=T0ZJW2_9ZZZZ
MADRAIADFEVQTAHLHQSLELNPILVTALNPVIGYERAAAIAKERTKVAARYSTWPARKAVFPKPN